LTADVSTTALLVDLLAAAQDSLDLGSLAASAVDAGLPSAGVRATRAILDPLRDLEAQGAVSLDQRYALVPPQAETTTRELIRAGRFEPLAAIVATHQPLPTRTAGWRRVRGGTLRRELRRALLRGDGPGLVGLLERWRQQGERLGSAPGIAAWLDDPLEPALLRGLPDDLVGPLVAEISVARAERMVGDVPLLPVVLELWQRQPGEPDLRSALAREALLAGELELGARALAGLETTPGLALQGLQALIRGEIATAVRRYARALSQRRKAEGSGVSCLLGPEGALAPLAYLHHPSPSRRSQGQRLLAAASPRTPEHPLAVLMASLQAHRGGRGLDSGRIARARQRALACGHRWLAAELEVLFSADASHAVPGARALWTLDAPVAHPPPPPSLGRVESWRIVEPSAVTGPVRDLPHDPRTVLRLLPSGPGLVALLRVRPCGVLGPSLAPGQGAAELVVQAGGEGLRVRRDLAAEIQAATTTEAALPSLSVAPWRGGARHLEGVEQALELLVEARSLGDALRVEWPVGKPLRLDAVLGPEALFLSVRGRGDWFEADGGLVVDKRRVLELHELLDGLGRASRRFVQLGDGQYLALTSALQEQIEQLARLVTLEPSGELRIHRLAAGAVVPVLDGAGGLEVDESWRLQIEAMGRTQPREHGVPRGLQAELRSYQQEGFAWLARLAELGAGACLADDMGLGKTVQVLGLLLQRAWLGPALVVAPTSVCTGWMEQAARFAPELRLHRLGLGDRVGRVAGLGPGDVLVCSYGLLQAERPLLADRVWSTAVLDEAQAIKNPDTARHQAACALQAEQRVITTGTPIENHLGELWALLHFLNPGLLGSWESFRFRFAEPIDAGLSEPLEQLKRVVLPFILRRTKATVLQELPPRTDVRLDVDLFPDERALYTALRERAEDLLDNLDEPQPLQVLAQLTRLRLACCSASLVVDHGVAPASAKLAAFGELVQQLVAGGHRALVFSQFVRHLTLIRGWLDEHGVTYQYLDGSTPSAQRDRAVRDFQAGHGDLFLISLRAGGFGLNLTAAQTVIHMDPWWNPAVEDQASDRVHRIGQDQPVTVYRLVARGTVEEKILTLHKRKRELADSLLDGSDAAGRLNVGELMGLIRG